MGKVRTSLAVGTSGAAGLLGGAGVWLGWMPAAAVAALVGGACAILVWALIIRWTAGFHLGGQRAEAARQAVPELTKTAHTLADLADAIAGGARDEAAHVGDVATALQGLSGSVAEVASHAQTASAAGEEAVGSAETGSSRAQAAIDAIQRVAAALERSAAVMHKLEETQARISGVVGVIRELANETNLLALNAAIEAARAGQHGAGFAVVAGEVRTLANRTKEATGEISTMVGNITTEIAEAVAAMRTVQQEVDGGTRLARDAGESFEAISRQAGEVRAMIARIAQAAEEQSATTSQVADTMGSVASSSAKSSRLAGKVSQASQTLWVLADELQRTLNDEDTLAVRRSGRGWVLKLAFIDAPALVPQAVLRMADQIEKRSGGRLRVERTPVPEGVGERQLLADLRRSANAFGYVSTVVASNYVPELQVFSLPYAFASAGELYRALDGAMGRWLLDRFRPLGLVPLGYLDTGARHLTCGRRPVRTPEDLHGLSMRVMESSVTKATAGALGAVPQAMTLPQFKQALATGTIDAADSTLDNYGNLGTYRHHRHLTLSGHAYGPTILAMAGKVFEALPPELRAVVEQAAREAVAWQRERAERVEAESLARVQASGAQVVQLSAEERAAFVAATRPVWDQFRDVVGDEPMRMFTAAVRDARQQRAPAHPAPSSRQRLAAPARV
ncbi:MAG: TRAP transporter substrate-binding protein DctP [Candidatus Rokubacteria bacterium]|nr:TRAP transporter substrate-binding protein DctP [Candidatus Rokubacteria bacterium]